MNNFCSILLDKLQPYNAKLLTYQDNQFIGILNNFNENHIAITFDSEHFTVEFTTQQCRFPYDNIDGAVKYIKQILFDEIIALEFYVNGKGMFGGSRDNTFDFSSINAIANSYALGNSETCNYFLSYFEKNKTTLVSNSFSGKYSKTINLF